MPAQESGSSSAQHVPLLAEPFMEFHTHYLAGKEAQRAFALGGELGYRRYLFQSVYGEMERLYGRERLHSGRVIITSAVAQEAAQPGSALEDRPTGAVAAVIDTADDKEREAAKAADEPTRGVAASSDSAAEVRAMPAGDVPPISGSGAAADAEPYDGIEAAGESGGLGVGSGDDPVPAAGSDMVAATDEPGGVASEGASTGDGGGASLPSVPATPGIDSSGGGAALGAADPWRDWRAGSLGTPFFSDPAAAITRLHSELEPLRTAYAEQVAQMRASADSELARELSPNVWRRARQLGRIAVNPRQYLHGREQIRQNNVARDAYLQKFTEYLELQIPADRAIFRSDEAAAFEGRVEDRWRLLLGAQDPSTIPPADRAGIRRAESWLSERRRLRVGRFVVQRSIAVPALTAGALLGVGAGVAVVTVPVWGLALAGAGAVAAGAAGRWIGAARATIVNRYQLQNDDFRARIAAAVQRRHTALLDDPVDPAGGALAGNVVDQYDATTREITRANLARLLGAEAAGAAFAEAGFIAFGLAADGLGHLINQPYATVPHDGSTTPTPRSGHSPTPHRTPTPVPNYGNVNIHAAPYDVAAQLGSPDPLHTVRDALAQFDVQKGAHYSLMNNVFGASGEQIVDGATGRLLTPAQQTAFNQFMYNLVHTTPGILDP